MSRGLLKNAAIDYAGAVVSAASDTDDNSSRFDMAGYEHVMFVTTITDSTDTGTCTLTVQTNTADSDTGMTASPATKTVTSAADDDLNNELLIVELKNCLQRYVQGTRATATANGAFGQIFCIRYGAKKPPITQSTSTVAGSISIADS